MSEMEAYSLGARIEAELDEANFLSNIKINDQELLKALRKIDVDTRKHKMLLTSHSKGHA